MSLACDWGGEGFGDDGWWYFEPEGYSTYDAKRGKRCCSCKSLLRNGDLGAKFARARSPRGHIEESIYGEGGEVDLAAWWMCESCADLYFSLADLGYCVDLYDDMRGLVREYAQTRAAGARQL